MSPCSPADHLEVLNLKDSWAMALDLAGSLRPARTVLDARVTNCGTNKKLGKMKTNVSDASGHCIALVVEVLRSYTV